MVNKEVERKEDGCGRKARGVFAAFLNVARKLRTAVYCSVLQCVAVCCSMLQCCRVTTKIRTRGRVIVFDLHAVSALTLWLESTCIDVRS